MILGRPLFLQANRGSINILQHDIREIIKGSHELNEHWGLIDFPERWQELQMKTELHHFTYGLKEEMN